MDEVGTVVGSDPEAEPHQHVEECKDENHEPSCVPL